MFLTLQTAFLLSRFWMNFQDFEIFSRFWNEIQDFDSIQDFEFSAAKNRGVNTWTGGGHGTVICNNV